MAQAPLPGARVGHWTDSEARTGCTVVLLPGEGAIAAVDVRGGAPGTRETDLLRPGMTVERVHAIALCGGSAFGLAAADGVMRYLEERHVGFPAGPALVPIVPAAVVFDLGVGRPDVRPGPEHGYAACVAAEAGAGPREGAVGAGTGATVGKLLGPERASPGGVGLATVEVRGGAVVGAIAVANAVGDVVGEDGRVVAGARLDDGSMPGAWRSLSGGSAPGPREGANTTLVVIATDAALDRPACLRLAGAGHDGLALAIRPAHTRFDGDTVFAASTGGREADPIGLELAAVEAVRKAIIRAAGGDV